MEIKICIGSACHLKGSYDVIKNCQAYIESNNCGICQMNCPPGALKIHLDLSSVQHAIHQKRKVVASIAPSFAGVFNLVRPGQIVSALKRLGFHAVEETARGAEIVSLEYEKCITEGKSDNIITSCCPSSNYLIQRYYKKALDSVIPVVSPMIAHGYDIKKRYGRDTFVVFIGPCLAKKAEAVDMPESIDGVITFKELTNWLNEEHIYFDALMPSDFETPATKRGRAYPLGGSLWRGDMKTRINPDYTYVHVDGIEACETFLQAVDEGEITGFCAELNICSGSCLNGPDMPKDAPSLFKRMSLMAAHANQVGADTRVFEPCAVSTSALHRNFPPKSTGFPPINDNQISEILIQMEKYTEKDQMNCGACGYSSCYDKAVAISRDLSDVNMCLDTLRRKAESLQGTETIEIQSFESRLYRGDGL